MFSRKGESGLCVVIERVFGNSPGFAVVAYRARLVLELISVRAFVALRAIPGHYVGAHAPRGNDIRRQEPALVLRRGRWIRRPHLLQVTGRASGGRVGIFEREPGLRVLFHGKSRRLEAVVVVAGGAVPFCGVPIRNIRVGVRMTRAAAIMSNGL